MNKLLEKEKKTFETHKKELLKSNSGKYVLIKEDKIIKIFESEKDALCEGIKLYGNEPFLVKKIEPFEQVQNFTSNLIYCEQNAILNNSNTQFAN